MTYVGALFENWPKVKGILVRIQVCDETRHDDMLEATLVFFIYGVIFCTL